MSQPMNSEARELLRTRIRECKDVTFDPDEFATAFSCALNAVSADALREDAAKFRLYPIDEDGTWYDVSLRDTPLTRIFWAMRERYAAVDKKKFFSAWFRITALLVMVESGELAAWLRLVPGRPELVGITGSVFEAAATVRLNAQGQFPVGEFVRKVKEINARKRL